MAEFNERKREELAQEAKSKENEPNLSYGIEDGIAVVKLGLLGYYIYQRCSPVDNKDVTVTPEEVQTQVEQTSLKWSKL